MDTFIQLKQGKRMFEGRITYDEGDLVEAIFEEKVGVSVGDPVTCMVTKNYEEITHFDGIVLAKDDYRLFIFHPPSKTEYKEQRRRYPRFDVGKDGWIRILDDKNTTYSHPKVHVVNISLGGLAFRYDKAIPVKTQLTFYTELHGRDVEDGIIESHLEVIHAKEEQGYIYGCKVTTMSGKNLHKLRKYLLHRQLSELKAQNKS